VRRIVVIASALVLLTGFDWADAGRAHPSNASHIRVTPAVSMEDQRLDVRVEGLAAHQLVTVGLRSTDAKGYDWISSARYTADARGNLDLSRAASLGGSYPGVWGMGLVASMRSTRRDPYGAYFWHRQADLFTVTVTARGNVVASSTFHRSWTRRALAEQDETVSSAGFDGSFFSPSGAKHRTTVLVLGGSEGGNLVTSLLASRLAADGFPALAVAYFGAPGLPQTLTDIPLEYFQGALAWLGKQPQVDPSRVVVLGISRGSEAALLLGVHDPDLVHGVIALVPSSVLLGCTPTFGSTDHCTGGAWSLGGKPLPYTEQFNQPSPTDVPAAVIPVERIAGPLLLACGGIDAIWRSCAYAEAIISRLDVKHNTNPHSSYTYLAAGHLVGALIPYEPGWSRHDTNIPSDEQAREQLWPHVLQFLKDMH
jgi:dienelactone hydrolase